MAAGEQELADSTGQCYRHSHHCQSATLAAGPAASPVIYTLHYLSYSQVSQFVYEGRSINKLKNGAIPLIFQIVKI